jgi:serine-type D-Ala-D-Ala carboxypeptidase/endopeptidase (penicillin-binding protein 4)
MYAGNVFADFLKSRGFEIKGKVVRDLTTRQQYQGLDLTTRNQQWQTIFIFETPIEAVIRHCNKESMNLYAEALCKRMGAAASTAGGSWPGGTAVTANFLRELGVPDKEFHLDDGCGLSRENAVTANAILRVLLHDYYSASKDIFIGSLPVGGEDGTLRHRFSDSLRGHVFAKTGFIANVSSLSGFLQTRKGNWYAFSILMNGIPDLSNSSIKPLQQKIVEAIDEYDSGK